MCVHACVCFCVCPLCCQPDAPMRNDVLIDCTVCSVRCSCLIPLLTCQSITQSVRKHQLNWGDGCRGGGGRGEKRMGNLSSEMEDVCSCTAVDNEYASTSGREKKSEAKHCSSMRQSQFLSKRYLKKKCVSVGEIWSTLPFQALIFWFLTLWGVLVIGQKGKFKE